MSLCFTCVYKDFPSVPLGTQAGEAPGLPLVRFPEKLPCPPRCSYVTDGLAAELERPLVWVSLERCQSHRGGSGWHVPPRPTAPVCAGR